MTEVHDTTHRSLRLSAYQARHFNTFPDTGWIEIKPITLLFGANSSGKSALISVLPMLQQTVMDPNSDTPFVFTAQAGVDLGTFEDVAYQHQVSPETPIWFNLKFVIETEPALRRFPSPFAPALRSLQTPFLRVEMAASYNKKQRHIALTDFRLFDGEDQIFGAHKKTMAASQPWQLELKNSGSKDTQVMLRHFIPYLNISNISPENSLIRELLWAFSNDLTETLENLVHIGPLRDLPRRAYRLTGESPRDVGPSGENWLNILLQARNRKELASQVNEWLARLGYTLRIRWGKQGYVHPMLKDKNGLEFSLKDVGFGISQVLPILVQGFSSRPGTILILEQPEVHLHPQAQADLGDMLLAIAQRGVRLLVETHSEHLLLRLRRRVAESSLDPTATPSLRPDDLAIYFVEHLQDQSQVHPVPINELGDLDSPKRFRSFFSSDYQETLELSKTAARIREASSAYRT